MLSAIRKFSEGENHLPLRAMGPWQGLTRHEALSVSGWAEVHLVSDFFEGCA